MKTAKKRSALFTKLYFALVFLKYFCEKAKLNNKKKIEIDFVLRVINEVLDENSWRNKGKNRKSKNKIK